MKHRTERATASGEVRAAARPMPYVFLALACADPDVGGARYGLGGVLEVRFGRSDAPSAEIDRDARVLTIGVADPRVSASHARLAEVDGDWVLEDLGSTNGTLVSGARVASRKLADGDVFQLGSTLFVFRDAVPTPEAVSPIAHKSNAVAVATLLPEHEAALTAFVRVAGSGVPLLLLGESGTGKEVLARAAHALSGRRGAFVPVNCGALPETLTESQLFGHVKGAFSGAVRDEPGFVRASDGGTLFLDEIGDMPKTSQAALLRVLQEREVTPIGATSPVKVDLRVVAATHRPIETLGEGGDFRADLYARLAGFTHALPPLRERREDIGLIVKALLAQIAPGKKRSLAPELGRALLDYDWPLNVRELEQTLRVIEVLAAGDATLGLEHAPEALRRKLSTRPPARSETPSDDDLKTQLLASLRAHAGNVSEVARAMGRTRMQIHRWMKRFAIDPAAFR